MVSEGFRVWLSKVLSSTYQSRNVHWRCRVGPSLPRPALNTFVNITVGFGWVFLDLITPSAGLYSVVHITTAVPCTVIWEFSLVIVFASAGNVVPELHPFVWYLYILEILIIILPLCLLQVCAANFGEFCSIVGQEATEKLLVRNHPHLDSCKCKWWLNSSYYRNKSLIKSTLLLKHSKGVIFGHRVTVCFDFVFQRCPSSLICARTACGASEKPVLSASWWSPIPPPQRCDVLNSPHCLSASSATSLVG